MEKPTKFYNITPHPVVIDGVMEIPAFGVVARVVTETTPGIPISGIRVSVNRVKDIMDLPDPVPGVAYIVTSQVLEALKGSRPDVYAPDTGADAIRDFRGNVVAVRGLIK